MVFCDDSNTITRFVEQTQLSETIRSAINGARKTLNYPEADWSSTRVAVQVIGRFYNFCDANTADIDILVYTPPICEPTTGAQAYRKNISVKFLTLLGPMLDELAEHHYCPSVSCGVVLEDSNGFYRGHGSKFQAW